MVYAGGLAQHLTELYKAEIELGSLLWQDSTADSWLADFFAEGTNLQPDEGTHQKLWTLHLDQKNLLQRLAKRSLGIGYPLLSKKNGAAIPVFILQVQLFPDLDKRNHWHLKPMPSDRLTVHPPFFQWLSFHLPTLVEAYRMTIQQGSTEAITTFLASLQQHLPTLEDPTQLSRKALLKNWLPITDQLPHSSSVAREQPPKWLSWSALTPLKPDQALAFAQIGQAECLQLITNAMPDKLELIAQSVLQELEAGRSVGIISSRASRLSDLQAILQQQLPLFQLLQWTGQAADRINLRTSLELMARPPKQESTINSDTYTQLGRQLDRLQERLSSHYQDHRRAIFGSYSWSDVLGFYLEALTAHELVELDVQYESGEVELSPAGLKQTTSRLAVLQSLHQHLGSLQHPLNQLNTGIFIHKDKGDAGNFVGQKISGFLQQIKQLQDQYLRQLSTFRNQLMHRQEQDFQAIQQSANALSDLILLQQPVRFSSPLKRSWSGFLFPGARAKAFRKWVKAQKGQYSKLTDLFKAQDLFAFDFPALDSIRNSRALESIVQSFQSALQQARQSKHQRIQDELKRLNPRTAAASLPEQAMILSDLEQNAQQLTDQLTDSGLLARPLGQFPLTLSGQQRFLENLKSQLFQIQQALDQFPLFYDWQKAWLDLPGPTKRLVRGLSQANTSSWPKAFRTWYLNHLLRTHRPPDSYQTEWLKEYDQVSNDLRQLRLQRLRQKCTTQQHAAFKRFKSRSWVRQQLDDASSGTEKHSLPSDLEQLFPLQLFSSEAARHYLTASQLGFDRLILLDANDLDSEWLVFAQQKSSHQLLVRSGVDQVAGSLAEALDPSISMSLEDRLEAVHPTHKPEIQVIDVAGRLDMRTQKNEVEAQKIIQLLNGLSFEAGKTLPKLGIVTLSKGQRDLIAQLLQELKIQDANYRRLIQHLERNGLQVLHLMDLGGQSFDRLYCSLTIGIIDTQGNMPQDFLDLNSLHGATLLGQLQELAREALVVVHSLPAEEQDSWLEHKQTAPRSLAQWLRFWQSNNYKHFPLSTSITPSQAPHYIFLNQMARRLRHKPLEIKQEVILFGRLFPVVFSHEGVDYLPMVDNWICQGEKPDFSWESIQRKQLEDSGVQLLPVSTLDWWIDPKTAADKLSERIK